MARGKKGQDSRFKIDPVVQREILGITLLGVASLTVLSLLSVTRGAVTEGWLNLLRVLFGWGFLFVPMGLGAIGMWLLLDSLDLQADVGWARPLGATLLFLVILAALHLFSFPENPRKLAAGGEGGGYVGWILSRGLVAGFGRWGSYLTLSAASIAGFIAFLGVSATELSRSLAEGGRHFVESIGQRGLSLHLPRRRNQPSEGRRFPAQPVVRSSTGADDASETKGRRSDERALVPRIIGGDRQWRLPKIEEILSESAEQEISQADIRNKVEIIEETLQSFGVPAQIVEVNKGPTVTQFGVEPGYKERTAKGGGTRKAKVKVSKITSLSNDLALALAASPIRIEAPVPGRPIVGIEVPNSEVALVGLRGIMESEIFREMNSKLRLGLGRDVSGQPVVADLTRMPHLLIAGATGSGKSVSINSIVTALLCHNTPKDLKLLLIDPKRVELMRYNGIPHLLSPVITEVERVVGALKWVTQEMDSRYDKFAAVGARDIDNYNGIMAQRNGDTIPYVVVIIDELADLMIAAGDQVEDLVCRIAQMARATGIHLIIATQRPSVDVVTGLIKANFPARISFSMTSQVDSRVILDRGGAERLLGRGDMLFLAPDASHPVRLQGSFVADGELRQLVAFWKGTTPVTVEREPAPAPKDASQPRLITDEIIENVELEKKDDLWGEAVALIENREQASISLLQRRLRIGFNRASRLMDELQEEGLVGPSRGPGKSRRILLDEGRSGENSSSPEDPEPEPSA